MTTEAVGDHVLTEHGTTDCPVERVRANVDDGACSACGEAVGGATDGLREAWRESREPGWFHDVGYAMQDVLNRHRYTYDRKGAKPDDPGWHECSCGEWEGYWVGFHEHVVDHLRPLAAHPAPSPAVPNEGCDGAELCSMGPTCPGGMLARLPGSGCWRTSEPPAVPPAPTLAGLVEVVAGAELLRDIQWRIDHYLPGTMPSGEPYSRYASTGDAALSAVRDALAHLSPPAVPDRDAASEETQ